MLASVSCCSQPCGSSLMVAALVLGLFLKKSTVVERGPTGAPAVNPPCPPLSKGAFIGIGMVGLLTSGVLSPSPSKASRENPVIEDGRDKQKGNRLRIDAHELVTRYLDNPAVGNRSSKGRI